MAVSLKKTEKVDLSKPEIPPQIREYTPIHLIDEEETIQRSRQPPTQLQHFSEVRSVLIENDIDVMSNDKDLETERKSHRRLSKEVLSFGTLAMLIAILTCIFVIIFLLVDKFSNVDNLPVESVPTESISNMVTSAVVPAESISTVDTSSSIGDEFVAILDTLSYIIHSPVCITFLVLGALSVFISLARKIIRMGRYDK